MSSIGSPAFIVGYDEEELVVAVPVAAGKLGAARALAKVPASDPDLAKAYPLTEEQARKIADVPPGLSYFLEAAPAVANDDDE